MGATPRVEAGRGQRLGRTADGGRMEAEAGCTCRAAASIGRHGALPPLLHKKQLTATVVGSNPPPPCYRNLDLFASSFLFYSFPCW